MSFKDISYLELWWPGPFVQWREHICAVLNQGIIRNISMNYIEFGPVVQEEMSFKYFLSRALAALLFGVVEPFMQFLVVCIMRNNSVKLFFNLDQWFRR